MSTRWTGPQAVAAGSMKWQILWVPKVTVSAARTCGSGVSPVSTSTPDGVSTATIGTSYSSAELDRGQGVRAEAGATADADDAVDHHVGRADVVGRADAGHRLLSKPPDRLRERWRRGGRR